MAELTLASSAHAPDLAPPPERPGPAARSPRRRRTWLAAGGLVLVVAVVGWLVWRGRAGQPATATTTTTVAASVQTLSQTVSATGTINPKVQSNLRFTSSGTVSAVGVKVGDPVSAGQTVASIDATDLSTAVELAQANVDSASANLSTVTSSGTASSTQIAAARSQLAAATAKLASAKQALAGAALVAPVSGTVAVVDIAVGDQVTSGATSSGGSSQGGSSAGGSGSGGSGGSAHVVVITTDAWVVSTSVTSVDLPLLKPGLQVQVLPTGARQPVFGTVSTIGVVATTTSGVASFPVTVAVTGSPPGLYAGASATVSITVREVSDALTVPTAAIRTEAGQTVVTKVVGDQRVTTPIQIGMVQGTLTQVTAGLAEGDLVLVERAAGFGGGSLSTGTRTRGAGQGGFGPGGQGGQQGQQGQGQQGQQPGPGQP